MSSYSTSLGSAPSADDEDFTVVDDEDYIADRADRTGLPVIPRDQPKNGDKIDVDSIKREYHTRAVRRSSPSANLSDVQLTSIPASLPREENEEDEVR